MRRIAILFAVAAVMGCSSTSDAAWHAWHAFIAGCDSRSFEIDVRDTTSGDRTMFARCTVINRSKK